MSALCESEENLFCPKRQCFVGLFQPRNRPGEAENRRKYFAHPLKKSTESQSCWTEHLLGIYALERIGELRVNFMATE